MFALALLCAAVIGVGVMLKVVFSLLGLVVRLVLLPLTLVGWLVKGTLGLALAVVAGVAGLIALLVIVPALLLTLLLPVILPLGLLWLIVHLARRRPAVP